MASPQGGRLPSHEYIGGNQGPPLSGSGEVNEVIDLSNPEPCSTAGFAGAKLSDFTIGDRLGATRDGGEGFQGCNSRVFRAAVRWRTRHTCSVSDGPPQDAPPASMAAPSPPTEMSSRAAKGGHHNGTPARRRRSFVGDIMDFGEQVGQVWKGSFGACFSGSYGDGDEEAREAPRSGKPRGGEENTEWALKMALTYAGQDPLQAAQDMETEIAILVGGRISPHANIMRGVHTFQDEIGEDLQPTLWAGLGPEVGQMLSSRTTFVVMPLFTAGSLQALLNKRRLRCKGPPFLRLLETMRFVEQMLSAVSHLLVHGIAHNDIKPDNWLLRADQLTLVLTDFGAAIDSLRPKRRMCSSSPAAPIPQFGAAAATAATGGEATFAGLTSGPRQSSGINAAAAATAAAATAAAATAAAADGDGAAGVASGEAGKNGDADTEVPLASRAAQCQPAAKRVLSVSERLGLTGKTPPGFEVDEDVSAASPAKKRRRHCGGEESGGWREDQQGGDKPGASSTGLSDKLLLPFSKYCVVGTPSIVAPELARAWREEKDLDFRRSDVFSVGVCMYRMLRPDSVYIDNGTGLEEGALEKIAGRFGALAWPLPLFPENKGGCPYEVAQLCRGLLQPDPHQRHEAFEGQSVVSWFVSRLETADTHDAKGPAAAASDAAAPCQSGRTGLPVASCGAGDVKMQPRSESASGGGDTCGASAGRRVREGSAIAPVDVTTPSPPFGGTRGFEECGRDDMVLSGDAGQGNWQRREFPERASFGMKTAARGERSEEERRLEEPDELVRSDRISHMRDTFASAAPEDLFRALDSKGWDVAAACAVYDDSKTGEQGGLAGGKPTFDIERTCLRGEPEDRASSQGARFKLWFDGVAEELKGRRREAFPAPRRQAFLGNHSQMPSSGFGT